MAVPNLLTRILNINKSLILKSFYTSQRNTIIRQCSSIQLEGTDKIEKKRKTAIVPKITLIHADEVSIVTLDDAQKLSKRRDLKLVKIIDVDTKSHRPVYKLMTGKEYHDEELKQREEKKKEKANDNSLKGEKVLMLNAGIGTNDLKIAINRIIKWVNKKYEARVIINGEAGNMERAENVFKFLEENIKDNGRILQKRVKGSDIKFSVNPPKKDKNEKDNKGDAL